MTATPALPDVAHLLRLAVTALGGQERPGQHAMANAVATALSGEGHLLVQAGTGTGKSLAYLVPAIHHVLSREPKGPVRRVIVATATLALQHQLLTRDLPRLADALADHLPRRPTFAVLKGRHNYVCLDKLHRTSAEDDSEVALFDSPRSVLGRQASRLHAWAQTTTTGDRDDYPGELDPRVWRSVSVQRRECLGTQICSHAAECFVELARDEARDADIVVTNHAMLAVHVVEGIPVLPEHTAIVIDEAHELVDRITGSATVELSAGDMTRAAARSKRHLDADTIAQMESAADDLEGVLTLAAEGRSGPQRIEHIGGDLLLALTAVRDAGHAALSEFTSTRERGADPDVVGARQRARGLVEQVHDVAGRLLALDRFDVAWLDPGERRNPTVRVAPLSVAGVLREGLFADVPVVLTSATLTLGGSFEPLATGVGLPAGEQGWTGLDVGSSFDHARQGILYSPQHLPPPGREGVDESVLRELADLLIAAGGRTLALFSSWRGVERAAEVVAAVVAERGLSDTVPLLVARRGDSVADLVTRFADEERSSLFGTMTLWQGVDVPGRSCSLVVIDRIPFPRPDDPVVAARSRAADESGGRGFVQVSVPRAALLLAQGVGRLIRSSDDRGVVAVLDSRLARAPYGEFLRRSLPPFWWTTDPDAVRTSLTRLAQEYDAAER